MPFLQHHTDHLHILFPAVARWLLHTFVSSPKKMAAEASPVFNYPPAPSYDTIDDGGLVFECVALVVLGLFWSKP